MATTAAPMAMITSFAACLRMLSEQGATPQALADLDTVDSPREASPADWTHELTMSQQPSQPPAWSDAELPDILTSLVVGHSLPRSESPFR